MTSAITRVALVFLPDRLNVYLRFGQPARERVIDRHRRVAEFDPDAVFCRIRWQANEYGTVLWHLSILQSAAPADTFQRIPGIVPGAAILLHADTRLQVETTLQLIDAIEALDIDPADVPATYWRTISNRLQSRVDIPPYTLERHFAHRLGLSLL
jgi:hypothetical protein